MDKWDKSGGWEFATPSKNKPYELIVLHVLQVFSILIVAFVVFVIDGKIGAVQDGLSQLNVKLEEIESKSLSPAVQFKVTATMYHPVESQTDSTPDQLASGIYIKPSRASSYRFVALSRDLLARWGGPFDYGDYVVIEGAGDYSGIWKVQDTMSPKFSKRIDFLCSPGTPEFKYDTVTLYKI